LEIDRRAELEKELLSGIFYTIGSPPLVAATGKQGYIEYIIAIEKHVRKELKNQAYI